MVTAAEGGRSKIVQSDPLQIDVALGVEAEYRPLGFPLRLATNSRLVTDAAACAWSSFPPAFDVEPIGLRVLVEPGDELARPPVFRAHRHLITITAGAESFAVCDHTRRFAFCRLNEQTAADLDFVRYYFLEAMALFMLTQLYVTPVHAAAIARGGRGLLLCGESGAGKSTLAYACARAGWTYISANESWLLRCDARTVLGNPSRIRLRDRAVEIFSELEGRPAVMFNGKRTLVLDTAGIEIAFRSRPQRIVFLERGAAASVSVVDREEAVTRLLDGVIRYAPEVSAAHRESLERFVSAVPAVRMSYRGIEDGLPALERLLG
jgi:hypothetical protein